MAYKLNGKSYTDHALMDEVVYNVKIILQKIILKNTRAADEFETEEMMIQADHLIAIHRNSMRVNFFPFTVEMLMAYGYDSILASDITIDWHCIPEGDEEDLLQFCCKWFLDHYEEKNPYYRKLAGLPEYGTDNYDIYIDPNDLRLAEDDSNTDFNFSAPLHEYSTKEINTLEALGIMDEIRSTYTGPKYNYLNYLGTRRIQPVVARSAEQWDILFMPDVEWLVGSRFKEIYEVNRDIYMRRTYQDAYIWSSTYYDEMVMLMILCQTMTDIIVELPEWYIRRDIFDMRSVKYFLDSQGVMFYKEIPLKYQIKIVKNLNRLIRYKSTTKNVHDILEIFCADNATVYKYYLYKNYLYNIYITDDPKHPVLPEPWFMEDWTYDYGDEDAPEGSIDMSRLEDMDNMDENKDNIDHSGEYRNHEFGDEDEDYVPSSEETDFWENEREKRRVIHDENGNVFELRFVRTPIDESYDDYIKDRIYQEEYDNVTMQDKYWDGQNTHYLVRNQHLKKDFTIEGTKYMFLDYEMPAKDYFYQMCYFLNLLFTSRIDTEDVTLSLPMINQNIDFPLKDICIFLLCLSKKFMGLTMDIETPINVKKDPKHPFYKYLYADGGWMYDGGPEEHPPDPPEPENAWMNDYYDFGDEDKDTFKWDPVYGMTYDFGYHNEIDYDKEWRAYEFNEITDDSIEPPYAPEPEEWHMNITENGVINISGSDQAIWDFLNHIGFIPQDEWYLGNLYDYGDEGASYVTPAANCVGDFWNYDFYDETKNSDFMTIYYHHRMYDFNLGDPDYDPPVSRPKPTVPYKWWENAEPHPYTQTFDGQFPEKIKRDPIKWAEGGRGVRYTEVTRDSFYNWMSTDNPQLFIPTAGRIYGFNITVDIEEVKKNLALRHSEFEFQHGFTLDDFGCEDYIAKKDINSIEELLEVYRTNSECYKALEKEMEDENVTRDKVVTMNYLFAHLFTTPFDTEFYRLKSGLLAENYEQILKERNLVLYKYYKELMEEEDQETRKDMIRELLNNIVSILEYYMGTEDLKYVWSWIPTNSLQALTHYIQLMINFFKSWKVYFLDPHVCFIINDKKENRVGVGDQIVETRIGQWVGDNASVSDNVSMTIHRWVKEEYNIWKEVVDIAVYHQDDVDGQHIFDGRYAELTEEDLENPSIAPGGGVRFFDCVPYINMNGGNVAARYDIYNADGGTVTNRIEYMTLNGGHVGSFWTDYYPLLNDNRTQETPCDGGYVAETMTSSTSVTSYVNDFMELIHTVLFSGKKNNDLCSKNGLYLGDVFITQEIMDAFIASLVTKRTDYITIMDDLIAQLRLIPSMENIEVMIVEAFEKLFDHPIKVLEEFHTMAIQNGATAYTDEKVNEIIAWFNEMNPFHWTYEEEEVINESST